MGQLAYLRTTRAVRERCRAVLDLGRAGRTRHFAVDDARLEAVAARVLGALEDGALPAGRYAHFRAGGVDRLAALDARLPRAERATAKLELVVTSVLLDAGAGHLWSFEDGGRTYRRSEGLAVASLRAFERGGFSASGAARVDAAGLEATTEDVFCKYFAAGPDNPLVGVEGRVRLLRALGAAVRARRDVFGHGGRLGGLLEAIVRAASGRRVSAESVLGLVLDGLESVWERRVTVEGHGLGDAWSYAPLGEGPAGVVPFHKLAQWMTYSLVEPLREADIEVTELDRLTALADYRNGGLLVDLGALVPKAARALDRTWAVGDELVIEWRALTVSLLEEVATRVRVAHPAPLGPHDIEAATWSAGRAIAAELRPDATSPVRVHSDGTVF